MNGTFNGQILVDKLAKLNNTQQSIETLSHWCIFHRKKAKQVVETWDRQFHCSPRDQRVSFLYLANDILQNSRRKGAEFVVEFWKVLPDALNDVLENGDEFGRNAAMRLVDIWEERKVFGSRGQILKEELMGRNLESNSRNVKNSNFKLKNSIGDILEKIISAYEIVYDGPVDEESVLSKCRAAISCVEKVENEIGGDFNSGHVNGSQFLEEFQGQHSVIRNCIEQLEAAESSRTALVSHLKEALQEQECKLEQVRNQLQAAQTQSEQVNNICQQLLKGSNGQFPTSQRLKEATGFPEMPPSFIQGNHSNAGDTEQTALPMLIQQTAPPFPENPLQTDEDHRKMAAAAVAAKLAASTSSAQMLSYVLSSLASEGVIKSALTDVSADYPSEKRPKLENGITSYTPQLPHPPAFPHPDSLQHKISASQQLAPPQLPSPHSSSSPAGSTLQPPPPPPLPPPPPPPPPPSQFMQTAGAMTGVPYSYGTGPQRPPPLPGYPMIGIPRSGLPPYPSPPNPYQNIPTSDGSFYG